MDQAASIERRLKAMEVFHQAGIRTTCFISPIFPELTDIKAIVSRAKAYCNLIWMENLNLRGGYKAAILNCIEETYPALALPFMRIFTIGKTAVIGKLLMRNDR